MNLSVTIRKAKISDCNEAAELVRQLGYEVTIQEMRKRLKVLLKKSDHLVAMALRENFTVGLVCACWDLHIEREGRSGQVTALVVAEGFRSQGIGTLLLVQAESWLRAAGATSCLVNSHLRRTDAHRFYEREGYRVTGLRFFKEFNSYS